MAYDRYERERHWREGRPEFSDEGMNRERDFDRDRDDRGFFGRMGDEFRSWFGDEEPERRRRISDTRAASRLEEPDEAFLFEMVVGRKGFSNSILTHEDERNRIALGVGLVGPSL